MKNDTLGSKLQALKERSGLSLTNIAKAADYKTASSIQRYFSEDYDAEYLPKALADRMKKALVGFGNPPIDDSDISRLTEYGFMYDRKYPSPPQDMRFKRVTQDSIGVYTSKRGGILEDQFDITTIIFEESILSFACPEHLKRRSISGAYISTSHMMPRYMPGEIIFFETDRPASIGRDVVVVLAQPEGSDVEPYEDTVIGTLAALDAEGLELKLLNPSKPVRLPSDYIDQVWPILDAVELLAPTSNA
ncbi:hypothetical protein [Sphingomonas paucimobilis]|uniref:hypothetical protein n=1 Tax=Sphingomonas paucimobilis TaxID=13689 RepID=UPI00064B8FFF|nr:hypothetical protein [Sphingomonas paucimobilis]